MTFDEAVEKLKALSDKGADTWYGDSLDKHTNVKGHIEAGDIETIIYNLRQEYAPTIKMTQSQYNELMKFKQKFGSSHLAAAINQGNNGTWSFLDELSGRIFEHGIGEMTDEYIEIIMQAWLHPETIKIVDE